MSLRPSPRSYEPRARSVDWQPRTPRVGLVARSREHARMDQLLWHARRGRSGALALRGEPGVGKSALIDSAVARATEFHTVQVRGRLADDTSAPLPQWPDQSLNDLAARLRPAVPGVRIGTGVQDGASRPPDPQRAAVEAAASSLRRMLDGFAGPLLVTIDDCQELQPALVAAITAAVLGPLADQPVSLILAWRDTPHLEPFELGGPAVPVHVLGSLTLSQARDLLGSRCDQVPSARTLSELVDRTGGNPLALIDLCSRLTEAQLAGWHPLPDPLPAGKGILEAFDVVRYLPAETRRALAVVAAGRAPTDVLFSAMKRLSVSAPDLEPAIDAGIVCRDGPRLEFFHPLVRSVAFHRAPPEERRSVRRALSDALAETNAIEASAYHASVDVVAPDEVAARRLVEAAHVALERGDPAAAARYCELAARCAATLDAAGQHLTDAAGHWLSAGERERASYCVELGRRKNPSAPVAAELAYRGARLASDVSVSVSDRMVAAAETCAELRPHRALGMLIDAAALRVLGDDPAGAVTIASRAVDLAGRLSTQSEVLARTVRAAALGPGEVDEAAERGHVSLLIGQTDRFPSSPETALVVGRSLVQRGLRRQADRWRDWIMACAARSGDVTLAVVPPLLDATLLFTEGDVESARESVVTAVRAAEDAGSTTMAAYGIELATRVHAAAGDYAHGLRDAARLFSMGAAAGAGARLRTFVALALLELEQGRGPAAVAMVAASEHELCGGGGEPMALSLGATVRFLAGERADPERWLGPSRPVAEPRQGAAAPWEAWLRGVTREDPHAALDDLARASAGYDGSPLVQCLVDICSAVRLAEAGMPDEARVRLAAIERRMAERGAAGFAALAARERAALPGADGTEGSPVHTTTSAGARTGPAVAGAQRTPEAEWEITLLGEFSIRHRGKPVNLRASLATQAIKVLALRPRVTVDHLIELLWTDAEPGVGARRLRNVLWRIRSACGDLVVRDGSFLRLAAGAATDLERFRALADAAILGADAGDGRAAKAARAAVERYRGELLPGDRYADWATAERESASRAHLQLLGLMVDDAVQGGRQAEALGLLERLADADPYDERHHLRAARIHLDAGHRGSALGALGRAERMLAELGVGPSPGVEELRERLRSG